MSLTDRGGGRRGALVAAAATAALAVTGTLLVTTGVRDSPGTVGPAGRHAASGPLRSESPAALPVGPTEAGQRSDGADLGPVLDGVRPAALRIPRIDVDSRRIVGLGLAEDGSLEVPRDPSTPGWFTPGPAPGQFGPAVIAGHVDGRNGPAVFYRLGELRRGDRVHVTREDGSDASFVVDRVREYDKDAFPTRAVYGNTTNRAELRLITCSGAYDERDGYLRNTVVFAHLLR